MVTLVKYAGRLHFLLSPTSIECIDYYSPDVAYLHVTKAEWDDISRSHKCPSCHTYVLIPPRQPPRTTTIHAGLITDPNEICINCASDINNSLRIQS